MLRTETIYYLEMNDPAQFRPSKTVSTELQIRRSNPPQPEVNRFFYTAVGGDWWWVDRLGWTYEEWARFLRQPGHETWIAFMEGTPVGYFELQGAPRGKEGVEIVSFGLLPAFLGCGWGGFFLNAAIRRAWAKKPARVWLHTCSFDHPKALANYQARGFVLVHTEEHLKEMPEETPGPWPGAR